ncbi:MAG: N-acetylmuramoyl-L-alanine amidase [Defluviitaleaceae bacterium]|nr:N-acetylmuramoyl-L-alanine amidase [Defluviitaleaceae bacterium]
MKVVSIKIEKLMVIFYLLIIGVGIAVSVSHETVQTFSMPVSSKIVLIDAGHGGVDTGKIAEGNVLEKDINLAIALRLQSYLEQGGSQVLLTRATDEALGDTKSGDMQGRRAIANEENADILVSIHQNAFSDTSVHGAQVFYYDGSESSKRLAEYIQEELKSFLGLTSNHQAKANDSYFILRRTTIPAVIVECGFLTNYNERKRLETEEYQDKVAWAIYQGIVRYFNQ